MSDELLRVHDVSKAFGPVRALSGVSLTAHRGQVHAVLGENGAGKSTLMKILSGAVPPDRGEIVLDGHRLVGATPHAAQKAGIAMVYQEPQLCPDLTVAQNVFLGREPTRRGVIDDHAMNERTRDLTRSLLGEALDPTLRTWRLSPGDQQVVAIARALSQEPKLLILDEPTSSMSAAEVERLFQALDRLKSATIGILYISHFLEEVERIADRYTVLRDGRSVGEGAIADVSMKRIVELMVGQPPGDQYPRSTHEPGEVLLELTEAGSKHLPVRASLALRRGEVLGIAGLVGSGRTELLRMIFGLEPVVRGDIQVGAFRGPASPGRRLEQGVGLLSENRKEEGLASAMSIAENITLSRMEGLGPLGLVLPSRERATADAWITRMGVKCSSSAQPVSSLSGGNQQKVALGRLLHHGVDVMLLDEPTRGIDVRSRAEIYALIDELAQQGRAVLMVSSYLPELFGVCDRIAVMHKGMLGPARAIDQTSPEAVLSEATGT